jgi:branched-chain amino acid transport system substrate-binding protein
MEGFYRSSVSSVLETSSLERGDNIATVIGGNIMRGKLNRCLWVGLLVFCVALFSCSRKEQGKKGIEKKEPYKIGAIFSVTGPSSFLGDPEKKTVEMIVEKVNQKGGINGHPVEVIVYDDQGQETSTVVHMRKLVEKEQVLTVIGPSLSGTTLAIVQIAEESKMPLVSCAASILISQPVKKWVFQTPQTDVMAVEKIVEYLKDKNFTKVGIITVSTGFGKSGKEAMEKILPSQGIEIVSNEVYNPQPPDLRAQLTNMIERNPQAIICWDTNPGPATLARNLREMGKDTPLIMSHGVASKKFIELAGQSAEGIVLPAGKLIVADQLPETDSQKSLLLGYKQEYESKYQEPVSTFGGHGWDALQSVLLAMEKAGTDRERIREQLENLKNFKGIGGVFNRSPEDHNGLTKDVFVLVRIENGNWKLATK